MSTYVERWTLRRTNSAPRPAERRRHHDGGARERAHLAAAWEELWKRTMGGSFERLPDPARHPECWFKII